VFVDTGRARKGQPTSHQSGWSSRAELFHRGLARMVTNPQCSPTSFLALDHRQYLLPHSVAKLATIGVQPRSSSHRVPNDHQTLPSTPCGDIDNEAAKSGILFLSSQPWMTANPSTECPVVKLATRRVHSNPPPQP
jgi:hypothetical protein